MIILNKDLKMNQRICLASVGDKRIDLVVEIKYDEKSQVTVIKNRFEFVVNGKVQFEKLPAEHSSYFQIQSYIDKMNKQ
jgi:hypothetical protein